MRNKVRKDMLPRVDRAKKVRESLRIVARRNLRAQTFNKVVTFVRIPVWAYLDSMQWAIYVTAQVRLNRAFYRQVKK
jgi:hypothetical protein